MRGNPNSDSFEIQDFMRDLESDDRRRESHGVVDFVRASGDCVCDKCGKKYYQHPMDGPEFEGHKWLRRICSGRLVKL